MVACARCGWVIDPSQSRCSFCGFGRPETVETPAAAPEAPPEPEPPVASPVIAAPAPEPPVASPVIVPPAPEAPPEPPAEVAPAAEPAKPEPAPPAEVAPAAEPAKPEPAAEKVASATGVGGGETAAVTEGQSAKFGMPVFNVEPRRSVRVLRDSAHPGPADHGQPEPVPDRVPTPSNWPNAKRGGKVAAIVALVAAVLVGAYSLLGEEEPLPAAPIAPSPSFAVPGASLQRVAPLPVVAQPVVPSAVASARTSESVPRAPASGTATPSAEPKAAAEPKPAPAPKPSAEPKPAVAPKPSAEPKPVSKPGATPGIENPYE
jgi:hypothetical protein